MSIIWAALIFVAGLSLGATLAFLVVVVVASRAADDAETIYRGGEPQ